MLKSKPIIVLSRPNPSKSIIYVNHSAVPRPSSKTRNGTLQSTPCLSLYPNLVVGRLESGALALMKPCLEWLNGHVS